MNFFRRPATIATAGVVGIALLAGCNQSNSPSAAQTPPPSTPTPTPTPTPSDNGVAVKTAKQILAAMSTAIKSASSTHMSGKMPHAGGLMKMDMYMGKKQAKGSITGLVKGSAATMNIITTQGKTYFQGREFWRAEGGATAEQLFGDRWVTMPAKEGSQFESFMSLSSMASGLLKPSGTVTKEKQTTVAGQPVIGLRDSDGSTMYVATTGEPYPVEILPPAGKAKPGEKMTFSEWNAPLTVTAPADSIDFSKYGNHSSAA
jgi:hypothetical protein